MCIVVSEYKVFYGRYGETWNEKVVIRKTAKTVATYTLNGTKWGMDGTKRK